MACITGLIEQLSVEVEALEARASALDVENEELRFRLRAGGALQHALGSRAVKPEQEEPEVDDEQRNGTPVRKLAISGSNSGIVISSSRLRPPGPAGPARPGLSGGGPDPAGSTSTGLSDGGGPHPAGSTSTSAVGSTSPLAVRIAGRIRPPERGLPQEPGCPGDPACAGFGMGFPADPTESTASRHGRSKESRRPSEDIHKSGSWPLRRVGPHSVATSGTASLVLRSLASHGSGRIRERHMSMHQKLARRLSVKAGGMPSEVTDQEIKSNALVLDSILGVVVIVNAITIGMSCDLQSDSVAWLIVDAIFAFLFTSELLFKLCLLGWRDYTCGPERLWNLFEALLVTFALLEVALAVMDRHTGYSLNSGSGNFSLFRIVRLLRITRILRVVKLDMFSELLVMIKGTVGGIRTLCWSTVLISLPLYAVALVLRETVGQIAMNDDAGTGATMFKSVPDSFFTVFRCVVAGECTEEAGKPIFLHVAANQGWGYGLLYCITMLFMIFGLFNVIVAIFVENVIAGAKFNEQIKKHNRLRDQELFEEKTAELITLIYDTERKVCLELGHLPKKKQQEPARSSSWESAVDLEITPELFERLRQSDRFQSLLNDLDIADEDQFDLFDTLDVDGSGTIDLPELLEGIAKLRGDPRRSDVVAVGLILRSIQAELQDFIAYSKGQASFPVHTTSSRKGRVLDTPTMPEESDDTGSGHEVDMCPSSLSINLARM